MRSRAVLIWLVSLTASVSAVDQPWAALPAATRLVIQAKPKLLGETAVAKKEFVRFRLWWADLVRGLDYIGIDANNIEQVWAAAGDNYPSETVIVLQGKLKPEMVEARWKVLIKDQKTTFRIVRDGDKVVYAMDLPAVTGVIPGLPATMFVKPVDGRWLVMAFDKDAAWATAERLAKPSERLSAQLESLKAALLPESGPTFTAMPPPVLTAPQSVLEGVAQLTGEVIAGESLTFRMKVLARNSDEGSKFAERLRSGLAQVKEVFEPLAKQQGIEPRIIRLILEFASGAKVDASGEKVGLTVELSAEALHALFEK